MESFTLIPGNLSLPQISKSFFVFTALSIRNALFSQDGSAYFVINYIPQIADSSQEGVIK